MAVPLPYLLLVALSAAYASSPRLFSAASALCPRQDLTLLDATLRSQCPLWIEQSLTHEVNGVTLDKELGHGGRCAYYSVLFYASLCPFSRTIRPTFDALSIMFPQITHLVVEESSALPSLFSRYGVHSFPSILVVNGTTKVRYHGSKDLISLILLYKRITGLAPVADTSVGQSVEFENEGSIWIWTRAPGEILRREPYLAFSLLFICFRAFLYVFPKFLFHLKAVWFMHVWHANQAIFGEWSQLLEQALQIIDAKRLWSKKARNFQRGANNARVWASSLTSVSLAESSSSRSLADS